MHPILLRLGPLTLYTYGAALALAFLATLGLASRAARGPLHGLMPMREDALVDWGCWTMIGGLLGGRLLYVMEHWTLYLAHPEEIVAVWHGGLVWYGGLLGGLAAHAIFCARRRYPALAATDQIIPFVAVGHAIGRVGCFANGCCYGLPTTAWFGVRFPGHPAPVIPTQLLEVAGLLILAAILRRLQTPAVLRRHGRLFGAYLIGYGVLRWVLERWRAEQPLVWGGMTLPQLMSVVLFMVGMWLSFRMTVTKWLRQWLSG